MEETDASATRGKVGSSPADECHEIIGRKIWLVETEYGRLGVQYVNEKLWVHCDIWEWSKASLKDSKVQWEKFLSYFRRYGVKRMYSAVPESDPLVNKWQKMWGMQEVARHDGVVIFMKEI